MSIFVGQLIQGQAMTLTLTAVGGAFSGNESLTASLSTGGTDAAVLTVAPTWAAGQAPGAYAQIDVRFTSVQTAGLAPGYYVLQAGISDASAALAWGLVEVIAAAGQLPRYDWLVQPAEVLGLVPDLVTVNNLADLPRVITAATQSIRRYCSRWFTRRTVTKGFRPSYQGVIRLDEIPVNGVSRVAIGRTNAIRVAAPGSAQLARVGFATTGDYDSGLVVTGVTLTSTTAAVTTSTTLLYDDSPTIGALAAAIQAAGWTATTSPGYSSWPSAELIADAAQGALNAGGAWLDVYAEDASLERIDAETGMIWLASRHGAGDWNNPAWGPDRGTYGDARPFPALARVTYDAGYDAIPSPVVMATVETIQSVFSRLATDQVVQSERAADYAYTLKDQIDNLPDSAKHALSPYRIFNA